MKRYERIYSTEDKDDPQETFDHIHHFKTVVKITAACILLMISVFVYASEIDEYSYDVIKFIFRHGDFFGTIVILWVIYRIVKKARRV